MPTIDQLWLVISTNEHGEEFVVTAPVGQFGTVPLIATKERQLDDILPLARDMTGLIDQKLKLIKRSAREDLMDIAQWSALS